MQDFLVCHHASAIIHFSAFYTSLPNVAINVRSLTVAKKRLPASEGLFFSTDLTALTSRRSN